MQLTVMFKLKPTNRHKILIDGVMKQYIKTTNETVSSILKIGETKISSKDIVANLPSALKNQSIRDAKSIISKYKKDMKNNINTKVPVLKKPVAIWNNQNYKVLKDGVSFPVILDDKVKRIEVNALITEYQSELLKNKTGTLRITKKSGKYIAQISINTIGEYSDNSNIIGIDLGLKIPAVAVTDKGKTKFFGKGRQNKYMKRKFRSKRKKLGKLKKQKAIKKLNNKEQRWMKNQDHKISREIINFAKNNNVSIIRMEQLQNIRNTARTSRKNAKNLHTWSFYRLAQYIEYKANLEGIKVEYVNPKYTSQICPDCGARNHANDRKYKCPCGYKSHRDRVGAMNIIKAPMASGNRKPA